MVLAIFTLVKVSFFVGILAVLAVTVACLEGGRLRAATATAVGAASAFCLCWFGTGNGLGNLVPFARSSAAIIGGYSAAMSAEDPSRGSSYWYGLVVVVVIAVFVVAAVGGLPRRQKIGIGLVTALTLWLLFKEGFVRHDGHDLIFFSAAPLILMAFVPRLRPWTVVPGALLLTVITVLVASGSPSLVARPDGSIRNFSEEVATLGSPGRTSAFIQRNRRLLRAAYAIPEGMLDKVKGHTVDVSPWEETVAWAYPQVQFDPLPVIADYSAYTPSLDQADTDFLRGPHAPRFILRQNQSIDGRNPAFEPPATQLAIECRYRQVEHQGWTWQLLERGADRCGAPRYLGSVTTRSRQWVRVPTAPPGDLVAARFQFSLGAAWTLESTLFKPPNVFMECVDYDGTQDWRFVAATGPDLHVIRVSPTLGYNAGFEQASLTRFRFLIAGQDPEVKVTFYAIQRRPMASGGGTVSRTPVASATSPAVAARGGHG